MTGRLILRVKRGMAPVDKLRGPAGQCRAAAGQTASLPSSGRETRRQRSNSMQNVSAQLWPETTGVLLSEDAVLTCAFRSPSPPRAKHRVSVVPHPNSHCGIDGDIRKISSQFDDLGRQAAPAYPKWMTLPTAVSFGFCEPPLASMTQSASEVGLHMANASLWWQEEQKRRGRLSDMSGLTRLPMMSRLAFASSIQNAPSCR